MSDTVPARHAATSRATDRGALAVVFEAPGRLGLKRLDLSDPTDADVVVDVEWSGISTGTERLLWTGQMPSFPGMGYPLVPGYEAVGRIRAAGPDSGRLPGERVFVPGASCYGEVRGLFGAASSRITVAGKRVVPLAGDLAEEGILLALAATAYHALAAPGAKPPDLIVGHGVLGRLLARLTVAQGSPASTVWESQPSRREGAVAYSVCDPSLDPRSDYASIYDVSGDANLLNTLIGRLAPAGEIVLAGFYHQPLSFDFAPAFMREARLRIASEWRPEDLRAVQRLVDSDELSLSGLISHRQAARQAEDVYPIAFNDPACLKMILDWRGCA